MTIDELIDYIKNEDGLFRITGTESWYSTRLASIIVEVCKLDSDIDKLQNYFNENGMTVLQEKILFRKKNFSRFIFMSNYATAKKYGYSTNVFKKSICTVQRMAISVKDTINRYNADDVNFIIENFDDIVEECYHY